MLRIYLLLNIYHLFYIVGVPDQISDMKVDCKNINGNVSAIITWGEPFSNFDPITSYTVTYNSGDNDDPHSGCSITGNVATCTVSSLTPDKNYTFYVTANNSIGAGMAGVKWCIAGMYILVYCICMYYTVSLYVCQR